MPATIPASNTANAAAAAATLIDGRQSIIKTTAARAHALRRNYVGIKLGGLRQRGMRSIARLQQRIPVLVMMVVVVHERQADHLVCGGGCGPIRGHRRHRQVRIVSTAWRRRHHYRHILVDLRAEKRQSLGSVF